MEARMAGRFVIIISCLVATAHGGVLRGTMSDAQSGEALPGVHVSVEGTEYGAAADVDGHFELKNVPSGKYTVVFSLIGYEKRSRQVVIGPGDASPLQVSLRPLPWELDEVVVTATRSEHLLKDVPVTTEIITPEQMKETGALTVAEALDSHIGVQVNDDLSGKGITLRGVDPSRVLILVDGHRVVGRVNGSIDLGQLSLSDVERIEIVKGSGSTLYGSDALGGVINIITKNPGGSTHLNLSSEYGSFNNFDPEFRFDGTRGKFGTVITGKYERTDGFDLQKETPQTNGLERIRRSNFDTKFSFLPSPAFRGGLTFGYMHEDKRWIESEWFEQLQKTFVYSDYEWNNRYDAGISGKYMLSEGTELEASLHGSSYDHDWEKYTASGALDDTSITRDDILESSLQFNHSFSDIAILTGGGDFESAGLKSSQVEGGKKSVYSGDTYAQFEWLPVSSLTLLPGIRWEGHKTYGDNINPSFNFKWSPFESFALRGTIGRGFRAPSIKEIYFIFDHSAAGYIVYGGQEGLRPETSDNYSLTAEFSYGRRGLHRLTVFRNDLKNLIDFDLIEFTPTYWRGVYRYQNIYRARTEGLEWESKVRILPVWDLSFSYTYMTAHDLTEDVKLVNRPEHTVKFTSVFRIPRLESGLTLWGTYTDHKLWIARADTPDRTSDVYAPKRIVLNMIVNKAVHRSADAYFRIENISNDINGTYGYWPPRTYTAGLRFNLFKGGNESPKGAHQ